LKKLSGDTAYYFEQFACACAGDWTGHIKDEERFRAFVHAAHQRRVKLTAPELAALLLTRGFDREGASELADLYRFGRALLRERPALNYTGPKSVANRGR